MQVAVWLRDTMMTYHTYHFSPGVGKSQLMYYL